MKAARFFLYAGIAIGASLLSGCIDAVREGLTGGISSGLSAAIETAVVLALETLTAGAAG